MRIFFSGYGTTRNPAGHFFYGSEDGYQHLTQLGRELGGNLLLEFLEFLTLQPYSFIWSYMSYPLVNIQKTMENHHFIAG